MIKPYPLPTFADNIILSASELNLISAAQSILDGTHGLLNFPFLLPEKALSNFLLHRFRYLHWRVQATTPRIMRINGINAGAVANSATSGHVDLGNDFNGGGSNPYNLTLNRPYAVDWTDDGIASMLYEHVSPSGSLSLPYSVPTFSGVLQASQLNAVCNDTTYLINACLVPSIGYPGSDYGLGDATKHFFLYMFHVHRYLHFQGRFHPGGTLGTGNQFDFKMEINGDRVFGDVVNEDKSGTYSIAVDLEGSNNVKFSGDGNFVLNVSPPSGQIYQIELVATGAAVGSGLTTSLLCESPYAVEIR